MLILTRFHVLHVKDIAYINQSVTINRLTIIKNISS